MSHFENDFIEFFKELSHNNKKEWFHANKKRYEKLVKEPFKAFVDQMIFMIKTVEPELEMETKQAMFRINRDIRFSKDKSPYKTHVAANISKGGRMSPKHPGFYFQLSNQGVLIGGGAYQLEKEGLYNVRCRLAKEPEQIDKLLADRKFKKRFGKIQGEKNKRLPKEFQAANETQPLIANKQFFFMAELPPEAILDPQLPTILMDHYLTGKPLNDYLENAIRG